MERVSLDLPSRKSMVGLVQERLAGVQAVKFEAGVGLCVRDCGCFLLMVKDGVSKCKWGREAVWCWIFCVQSIAG